LARIGIPEAATVVGMVEHRLRRTLDSYYRFLRTVALGE
jgi:hypothetical protein